MSVHEIDHAEQGYRAARHVYYADSPTLIQFLWAVDLWASERWRLRHGYYERRALGKASGWWV